MSNNSSLWSDALRRLLKNRAAVGGAVILFVLILFAILAPWIAPYPYAYQNLSLGASPPSAEHLLGTDVLGRDLFSRIVYGARTSLLIGVIANSVSVLIGTILGLIAGYFGKIFETLIMRFTDLMMAFPALLLAIALAAILNQVYGLLHWL